MAAPRVDKWLAGVRPDETVCVAAVHTLRTRLAAVWHFLRLAARKSEEDVEYVHALRVWTRRATAAMRLYRDVLPRRRAARLKKQLRRIREAAAAARDLDVLIARHDASPASAGRDWLLGQLRQRRRQAQPSIVAVYRRCTARRVLRRNARGLLARVRPRGKHGRLLEKVCFGDWAPSQLAPLVQEFFDSVPPDLTDIEAIHRFRICGKKLRYAMELLAAAFPREFREQLYPRMTAVQDRLGEVNDHDVAQVRLREWIGLAENVEEVAYLEQSLADESARLSQALATLQGWWSSEQAESLRAAFDTYLAKSGCAPKPR